MDHADMFLVESVIVSWNVEFKGDGAEVEIIFSQCMKLLGLIHQAWLVLEDCKWQIPGDLVWSQQETIPNLGTYALWISLDAKNKMIYWDEYELSWIKKKSLTLYI